FRRALMRPVPRFPRLLAPHSAPLVLFCFRLPSDPPPRGLLSFPTRRSSDLEAASAAARTIAVLSPSYLDALYTQPEWAAEVAGRSEEHTSELQSPYDLVCRLLLEKNRQQTSSIEA